MSYPLSLIESLHKGGIVVIPTDTLYGIVCSARLPEAVERFYRVRGRAQHKPCIILIHDIEALNEFGIVPSEEDTDELRKVWPGKVSVVFGGIGEKWAYLYRDTNSLAFRVPDDDALRALLREIGPLLAPSANPEGMKPASDTQEAREYFGNNVSVYVDGGQKTGTHSTVARLVDGRWEVIREGAVRL